MTTENKGATESKSEPVSRPRQEGSGAYRPSGPMSRGPRRTGGRPRYFARRKVCSFCVGKIKTIDYKEPVVLRSYISDRSRIETRRKTGTCAKHQRALSEAIKRARFLALLPASPTHIMAARPSR